MLYSIYLFLYIHTFLYYFIILIFINHFHIVSVRSSYIHKLVNVYVLLGTLPGGSPVPGSLWLSVTRTLNRRYLEFSYYL